MAGTLTISTLSDGTNSTSSTNCIQGSAKAWVNWNGTNGSIRASYNISSVTRNSTGNYTITFTNAMSDANYARFCALSNDSGGSQGTNLAVIMTDTSYNGSSWSTVAPTASSYRLQTNWGNSGVPDPTYVSTGVFR